MAAAIGGYATGNYYPATGTLCPAGRHGSPANRKNECASAFVPYVHALTTPVSRQLAVGSGAVADCTQAKGSDEV